MHRLDLHLDRQNEVDVSRGYGLIDSMVQYEGGSASYFTIGGQETAGKALEYPSSPPLAFDH